MKMPAMIAAEFRRLTSTRMAVIALLALMAVPVLYGGLYLWANQDPYARLSELPVGLVVDDRGVPATSDTPERNYGQQVADELLKGAAFDWRPMDADQAAEALKDGHVDFVVTLPPDFSEALVSAGTDNPRQAEITLETNDANNYLASTIGTQAAEKIRRQVAELVDQEVASRMLTGLSQVRGKITTAAEGAGKLADGAAAASNGMKQLETGIGQVDAGAQTLSTKLQELHVGTGKLASGSTQVADGAKQVAAGVTTLAGYADEVATAAKDATARLPEVRDTVKQRLIAQGLTETQVNDILALLDPVGADLTAGNAKLQQAAGKIDKLRDGADAVASGAATVRDGAATVDDAVGQLADGAGKLAQGTAQLSTGAAQLTDGLGRLNDGATELHDGLASGAGQIPMSDEELRDLQAAVIANPVSVNSGNLAAAGQYGAGLAPFFAALAGWIGIYALFLIVKPVSKRAITALRSPVRITLAGWLTPAALGGVQMIGLFLVLSVALGFGFQHPPATLGIMVLASLTYAAIILALNVWMGSVGQFLALVLMVLQLVTAGGTFPWQTLPPALAWLHHVLPMSFIVDAMRQLMYGGDVGRVGGDVAFIVAWLAAGLLLTLAGVARMIRRRTMHDLAPSLIG